MMENKTENIIVNLTFEFASGIMDYFDLLAEKKKWVLQNQLMKSGTSIGANVREAQNAESKADFIHKFKIAAKECEETLYWLELCKYKNNLPDCTHLLDQIIPIKNILNKIII